MQWGLLVPIVAVSVWPVSSIIKMWIRARHGYALTNEKGEVQEGDMPLAARHQVATLNADNERQREEIAALHRRLAVLERIATDPGARIAAEIDALRHEEGATHAR